MGHIIESETHADLHVEVRRESFYLTRSTFGGTWADHGGTQHIELLLGDVPHLAALLCEIADSYAAQIAELQPRIESRANRKRKREIEYARHTAKAAVKSLVSIDPDALQELWNEDTPLARDLTKTLDTVRDHLRITKDDT